MYELKWTEYSDECTDYSDRSFIGSLGECWSVLNDLNKMFLAAEPVMTRLIDGHKVASC